MTDTGAGSTASPTWPEQMQWIELTALQRDLLELFYRRDRQSESEKPTLTDTMIEDELAARYGDVVPTDAVASALADLVDRSLLPTLCSPESDETEVQYTLTSTGQVLFTGRVVSLASLLTDEQTDGNGTAGSTEGQS